MSEYKAYLGDSVYADVEDGMVKLTTENGYPDDPRNVIFPGAVRLRRAGRVRGEVEGEISRAIAAKIMVYSWIHLW